MADFEPLRCGIVGLKWGRIHGLAARETDKLDIVACFSRRQSMREFYRKDFGGEECTSFEEMLARDDIECVILATPNTIHAEHTIQAAEAGKHVLVEKPIANTLADARRMIEACKAAGVVLSVSHSQRWHPQFRRMKKCMDDGDIGQPLMAQTHASHNGGFRYKEGDWRFSMADCPGGCLIQLAVHHVDTLRYFFGEVKTITAAHDRLMLTGDNPDVTATVLQFASGVMATISSSYILNESYFLVQGTAGSLHHIGRRGERSLKLLKPDSVTTFDLPKVPGVTPRELADLATHIREGTPVEVDGESGLRSLAVIWASLRSAKEKRPVTMAEMLEA